MKLVAYFLTCSISLLSDAVESVEEKLLTEHFGKVYRQYIRTTQRLMPGIW